MEQRSPGVLTPGGHPQRGLLMRRLSALLVASAILAGCGRSESAGGSDGDSAGSLATRSTIVLSVPDGPKSSSTLDPAVEDFYVRLADASLGAPGTPVEIAQMTSAPPGSIAYRFGYVSRNARGEAVPVSGSVLVPTTPAPPGGFPIAAFSHGTAGLADVCAPSRRGWDWIALRAELLAKGYLVVATDYIGLGTPGPHPYLDGPLSVRAVVDSIKAARQVPELHAGDSALLYGFSQGGQAALLAGEAFRAELPEVHLTAVAALAPFVDMDIAFYVPSDTLPVPTSSPLPRSRAFGAGVPLGGVLGLAAGTPGLDIGAVLTDEAMGKIAAFEQGCIQDDNAAFPGPLGVWVKADLRTLPGWREAIERATPGARVTGAPVFLAYGTEDNFMPPDSAAALTDKLCGLGQPVVAKSYKTGHNGVVAAARADLLAWLDSLGHGAGAPSDC